MMLYTNGMKKGAIFDLDGTLVNTIGLHEKAWKELFQKYGIALTDEELKEQSGKKNTFFISVILKQRKREGLSPEKLSDEKDEIVIENLRKEPPHYFHGVEKLLKLLKENGTKLALATSATQKTAVFLGGSLFTFFDALVFAEDVNYGKPSPEIFLKAAERLALKSEDCIVFEDATSGIEAAKAGGFLCVAKDNNLGQDASRADFVIKEYNSLELIQLFQ